MSESNAAQSRCSILVGRRGRPTPGPAGVKAPARCQSSSAVEDDRRDPGLRGRTRPVPILVGRRGRPRPPSARRLRWRCPILVGRRGRPTPAGVVRRLRWRCSSRRPSRTTDAATHSIPGRIAVPTSSAVEDDRRSGSRCRPPTSACSNPRRPSRTTARVPLHDAVLAVHLVGRRGRRRPLRPRFCAEMSSILVGRRGRPTPPRRQAAPLRQHVSISSAVEDDRRPIPPTIA